MTVFMKDAAVAEGNEWIILVKSSVEERTGSKLFEHDREG